jgi:two-component system heavy metal sensor histidine kinase CusS
MSSKLAPDKTNSLEGARRLRGAWSLAARLTLWYAISSFLLVALATTYLYWAMTNNVNREDDALLADKVRVVQAVLQQRPNDTSAIRQEVEDTWRARENERTYVRVVDPDGQVLVESPQLKKTLPAKAFPTPTAEPVPGMDLHVGEDQVYRVLSVRSADLPWTIQLAMDRSLESELLSGYLTHLWYVLALALIVCAAAGYLIAHRGVRPIRGIAEITRHIRPTNLSERVTPDGLPAELLQLAADFNGMLDQLEQSFLRLSRFSSDIAHELRTPVFSLRGEVEVALRKPRAPEEYREVLQSNLEECDRLTRLIDRLLFLARSENPQQQIVKEESDLLKELASICEFYEPAARDSGVTLEIQRNGRAVACIDRVLFQRAIGNLITNSIAHTSAGGNITVAAKEDDYVVQVEVRDSGCGIEAINLPHVFDRLYRVDNSRSSNSGGLGLGLAIVRTIATAHGGTVRIFSEVGRGTCVTLTLPKRTCKNSAAVDSDVKSQPA